MYRDFILSVDRGNPHPHKTQGRYRVCAKSEKQAHQLLQQHIGFGKLQTIAKTDSATLPKQTVVKEVFDANGLSFRHTSITHDTSRKNHPKI